MVARSLRSLGAPALLWCGCALAACTASSPPGPKSNDYLVSNTQTEFYKYGPAQAFGADLNLHRGDRVTMLKREFGFSQVKLADGTTGYLATEDLTPAPPPPPPPRMASHFGSRHSSGPSVAPSKDPLFDVNDVPFPPLPTP